MALESVTHVGDLVATNPTATDPKQEGDDHIRNIKTALLNTFVGFDGAIVVSGTDGGVVNAYTVTPDTTLTAYGTRMVALFSPSATSTGPVTLNISGLGAKSVKAVDGSALVAGDLAAGSVYAAVYTGTEFRLLSVSKKYVDLVREYAESVRDYADQLAFQAALPAQTGNSGKLLTTDGTDASWAFVPSFTRMMVITSTQSVTFPTGTTKAKVTVIGGGGSNSTDSANFNNAAGAGGAAIKIITVDTAVTYTATVGAGGAAVGAGVVGNSGGTSSFAGSNITTISATGGSANRAGGVGSGGDLNIKGGSGGAGVANATSDTAHGGASIISGSAASDTAGQTYGGGAGGVYGNATAGKAGADGVIIIEY